MIRWVFQQKHSAWRQVFSDLFYWYFQIETNSDDDDRNFDEKLTQFNYISHAINLISYLPKLKPGCGYRCDPFSRHDRIFAGVFFRMFQVTQDLRLFKAWCHYARDFCDRRITLDALIDAVEKECDQNSSQQIAILEYIKDLVTSEFFTIQRKRCKISDSK